VCLVVLGVAQLMAFSLLRSRFAALAAHPLAGAFIGMLGRRGMTVYLWHLPVLIGLSALVILAHTVFGGLLPVPLGVDWWATRPLWLLGVAATAVPVVALFTGFERGGRSAADSARARPVVLDTLLGAGGVSVALIGGFTVVPAAFSLLLLGCALVGTGRLARAATSVAAVTITSLRLSPLRTFSP
jgi:hypothetical protein